jgi:MFS family permease
MEGETTRLIINDSERNSKSRRLVVLIFMMVLRTVVLTNYSLLSTFYPRHIKASPYNIDRSTEYTGYVVSSFSPANVAGLLFIGHVALKSVSCKFCLISGLILGGGACTLFGFLTYITDWTQFFILSILIRMVIGFGVAAVDISSFTISVVSYPEKVGLVSGLMELTWSVGDMIGPPLGGVLYKSYGFIVPSASVGILMLLFSVLSFLVPASSKSRGTVSDDDKSLEYSWRKLVSFWTFMSTASAFMIMIYLAFPQATLSDYLDQKFNKSSEEVGIVFLAGGVPNVVFTPMVGKLCDIFNPRWFLTSGLVIGGGGFFLMAFGSVYALQFVAQAVIGTGLAFTYSSCYTDIYREVCKILKTTSLEEITYGKIYAVYETVVGLGEMTGSGIGGLSVTYLGFTKATIIWSGIISSFGAIYLIASIARIVGERDVIKERQ